MKSKYFFIICFVLSVLTINGQYIDKCYINAKTGDTVQNTTWENICDSYTYLINYRLERINSKYFLDLKYHFGDAKPFTILKDDSLWIKFNGGYTLTLFTDKEMKSNKGGAKIPNRIAGSLANGFEIAYPITAVQFHMLMENYIEKFRFFTSDGTKPLWIKNPEV